MEVLTATTGSEAIGVLAARPDVAIVLMDIMMPGMVAMKNHPGHSCQSGPSPPAIWR